MRSVIVRSPSALPRIRDARSVLRKEVSMEDAVFNMGRAALLVAGMTTNHPEYLRVATQDRLHQPYRQDLFPAMKLLFQAAMDAGALGVFLSGSGSTVLALTQGREMTVGYEMAEAAKQAGVDGLIRVEERELKYAVPPPGTETGLLITNPPYGQRMGETQKLAGLYRKLGERLRGYWPGWTAAIFTGNPPLCSEIRLRPRRTYDYKNGSIPCRFALYKLASAERMRELGSRDGGAEMLENRLRRNLKHLGKWARRNGITCYRLYDGDIPEYPYGVDLYTNVDDILTAHVTITEKSEDGLLGEARQSEGIEAIKRVLSLSDDRVIVKTRSRQVGDAQYERLEKSGSYETVKEGDARFLVNLTDFHDTGLFLDNRFVRAYIQKRAKGVRFLNLFGYTGSVTVSAALGGATASTTIDLSNTYIDWARRNFEANGLDAEAHQLVRTDCLGWLREAEKGLSGSEKYGIIYFDPPTFSNSKGMDEAFDVQRDHAVWIEKALNLLADEGLLIFRCNRNGFGMGFESEAFSVKDIAKQTLSMDFERRAKNNMKRNVKLYKKGGPAPMGARSHFRSTAGHCRDYIRHSAIHAA